MSEGEERALRDALEAAQGRLQKTLELVDELERRSRLSAQRVVVLTEQVTEQQDVIEALERRHTRAERDRLELPGELATTQAALAGLEARVERLNQKTPALPEGRLCRRCGADQQVVADVLGRGEAMVASIDRAPRATSFKNPQTTLLFARVCGRCGLVELQVA